MSDTTTTTEQTEQPAGDPQASEDTLGDAGKKALAEERRAKREAEKQLAALTARLKEFEDRDKTETQKLADRLAEAEARAQRLEAERLRLSVQARFQIADEDAELFLTGSDEETLTRQAERLRERLAASNAPGTPKPDLSQGTALPATPLNSDGLLDSLKRAVGA